MNAIYLDNNATTPVLPAVWEAMRPFLVDSYGNPASAHWAGRAARRALEDAREQTAAHLGSYPDEVVFTSGATEANNLAIFSLAGEPPAGIVTSPIEHPSVAEPIAHLARRGFAVQHLGVDRRGIVRSASLTELLGPGTRLLSVMLANNETGSLQPVRELAAMVDGRVAFHCDAAQAVGRIPVHFHDLGVTTLALSAHKFHGPKGAGALLVGRHCKLLPQLHGGHQQQGRRPGTEAVALAVGLATALDLAMRESSVRLEKVLRLRHEFLEHLRGMASPVILNGPAEGGVPHTLNLSFPGCRADSLLMNLDLVGVACSTGSACSSGSLLPSPVLGAMGVPDNILHSAMRFSFSALLSEEDVTTAAQRIAAVVKRLRSVDSTRGDA
ncbi:MAG TPA: cysteine desulfurase family protein [Gemmataceae bacterium]|jgi:cysteine desulfurase|nr:cysteine desulfurase family protein [Gemmataceae bacterium]